MVDQHHKTAVPAFDLRTPANQPPHIFSGVLVAFAHAAGESVERDRARRPIACRVDEAVELGHQLRKVGTLRAEVRDVLDHVERRAVALYAQVASSRDQPPLETNYAL